MIDLNSATRQFSLTEAWNLNRDSFFAFARAATRAATSQPLSYEEKIGFREQYHSLGEVKATVEAYRPTWCRLIYDLITATATVIKTYILRRNIPQILSQMDSLAQRIIKDPVIEKADLIRNAMTYMVNGELVTEVDAKAYEYFETTLEKLKENQNVPIPRWYNSPKPEAFDQILNAERLTENFCEFGKFFRSCGSSRDEQGFWFSAWSFTIAFDHHNAWGGRAVNYVVSEQQHHDRVNNTIWVYGGEHRIKLDATTIAFYVTSDEGQIEKLAERNISVFPRNVSERIRYILERVEPARASTRIVPSNWTQQYLIDQIGKPKWLEEPDLSTELLWG